MMVSKFVAQDMGLTRLGVWSSFDVHILNARSKLPLINSSVMHFVCISFSAWLLFSSNAAYASRVAPLVRIYDTGDSTGASSLGSAAQIVTKKLCAGLDIYINTAPNIRIKCELVSALSNQLPEFDLEGYIVNFEYYYKNTQTGLVEGGVQQTGGSVALLCPRGFYRHKLSHCWSSSQVDSNRSNPPRNSCNVGNPINVATREKFQNEDDENIKIGGNFSFSRSYANKASGVSGDIGFAWRHGFESHIERGDSSQQGTGVHGLADPAYMTSPESGLSVPPTVDDPDVPNIASNVPLELTTLVRFDHSKVTFSMNNGGYVTDVDRPVSLVTMASNGSSQAWLYKDKAKGTVEKFDLSGRLLEVWSINGDRLTVAYSPNTAYPQISSVTHASGRQLNFSYGADARLQRLTRGAVELEAFSYNGAGLLESVSYPDGSFKKYLYGEPGFIFNAAQSKYLTGIEDEAGKRYATFAYDENGAKSTEHTYGSNKYQISSWVGGSQTATVEVAYPSGGTHTQKFQNVLGRWSLTEADQPAGAGCSASSNRIDYDTATGNVTLRDDFNGKRVCYSHDGQNREASRVEGLPNSTTCASALAATNLPSFAPEARKISTQWHPDWQLQTRRAEPGKFTAWVYNGQADPFNGGTVASCAPPEALLPDGKPIAVLCKMVEQATQDATGAQGFAAPLDDNNVNTRTSTATYNQHGQVLTQTDARGNTTTYTYYTGTTTTHTQGDLWKVTNAKGHITEYTHYNPHGQVLQSTDPNGVVSSYTYDLRQRLTSATVAGETTGIEYWPTGLLKKVTRPDTSWLFYTYDDAHRLTDVSDNLGHKAHYTLDNAGNRTKEEVQDPSGNLTRQIDRTFDALNRLYKVTGAQQ